ncbi:MAG: pyruvate kinase [Nitrospinota bacterium]|nr:pyruvate kinase [Nitrospinota bacterium]
MTVKLTKIISTLGPASANKRVIKDLVRAGVNIFRLNLSHGDYSLLRLWIRWIREVEKEFDTFVGILLDLQGPKIRVGTFEKGFIHLHRGDRVIFTTKKVVGREGLVPVQFKHFHKDVSAGGLVYLDDGNLCVKVEKVFGKDVEVIVQAGGCLSDFKGLNMPDTVLSASALTPKDKEGLAFGLRQGIDLVALSFAGSAKDIRQLRNLIRKAGKDVEIIAKIERKQAVQRLQEIIREADGVMVARGDLGVEIPLAEVPVVQQKILRECTEQCKPVIVATQMLESMIDNRRPTRAEISDISNAVMNCADAIMLSAETAVGKFPKAAVQIMTQAASKTEDFQRIHQRIVPWRRFFDDDPPISLGIAYSAVRLVELLRANALLVFTETGGTARMVASPNPMIPLFAFTSNRDTARRLTLLRGTVPFLVDKKSSFIGDLKDIFSLLKKKRLIKKGERVVITTGLPVGIPQWTNVIRVEVVP